MAFEPDPGLLNMPLARPWRRGSAMLVDLVIIAFFTASLELYIVPILLMLWIYRANWFQRLINKLGISKGALLRVVSLIIFLIALASNFNSALHKLQTGEEDGIPPAVKLPGFSSTAIESLSCKTALCVDPLVDEIIQNTPPATLQDHSQKGVDSLLDDLLEEIELPSDEAIKLRKMVKDKLETVQVQPARENADKIVTFDFNTPDEETKSTGSSPLDWLYGLFNDLGLGFGLAVIYFSCFTAWSHGQTLGKTLLNIQVIQLNNSPITLWEAFGRYGGYGAGLATGLLGFLQIYWDYNRQAIQDKIASTVVIDLGSRDR